MRLLPSLLRPLLLLALLPLCTGCVSYWKGQEMQAELKALEGRIDQQVDDQRGIKKKLQDDLASIAAQLAQTEQKLAESIERLQSGNADNMLIVEQLREQLTNARGELAKLQHEMAQPGGATLNGGGAGAGAAALPDDPAELYRFGYERKQAGDCKEAIRAFTVFAQKFAKNTRADNSLFLLAECQYESKEYAPSIRTLKTVMDAYPKGDKVDDALVLMHDNFVALGQCRDAIPFLETLVEEYPRSSLRKTAEKRLSKTKRACR